MARRSSKIVHRGRLPHEVSTARVAMRNHCLECMGGQAEEVKLCTDPECHLWPYRLGSRNSPEVTLRCFESTPTAQKSAVESISRKDPSLWVGPLAKCPKQRGISK